VLLLLAFGLYQETVLYLIRLWNQLEIGEYAHGYLVLAISVYLILRKRRALSGLTPCPDSRALLAIAAAGLLWTLATLVDVQMLQTVGLLLLVLAMVWTVLGNRITRALLFPILFIGFAIPIWFPLSPVLQDLTADAVFWLIRLLGIPAFRQENLIVLPAGSLSIEGACSGLRYLLAALTLGTLYAYLNYQTLRARLTVVVISAAAAVLANMVRVFIVVYLGYATDMQHPLVGDHLSLGWYLFGGLVVILLVLDARLHRHFQPAGPVSAAVENTVVCAKGTLQHVAVMVAGVVLVSAGPAIIYRVNHQSHPDKGPFALTLPSATAGWAGPVASDDDWMPQYQGAITRKQVYQKGSERAILYIGYYPVQKQGEEVINDLNRISNKDVWQTRYPRARLRQTDDQPVLEQLLEKNGGVQRLVWYWYRVAGRHTTNRYEAKVLQVLGLVTGKPQASVMAVATDTGDDVGHARSVLGDFLSTMKAPLAKLADGSTHRNNPQQRPSGRD
jgi:exosortase A